MTFQKFSPKLSVYCLRMTPLSTCRPKCRSAVFDMNAELGPLSDWFKATCFHWMSVKQSMYYSQNQLWKNRVATKSQWIIWTLRESQTLSSWESPLMSIFNGDHTLIIVVKKSEVPSMQWMRQKSIWIKVICVSCILLWCTRTCNTAIWRGVKPLSHIYDVWRCSKKRRSVLCQTRNTMTTQLRCSESWEYWDFVKSTLSKRQY